MSDTETAAHLEANDLEQEAGSNGHTTPDPGSLQALLRDARERAQKRKSVDLAVPGYSGQLFATYTALPWDVVRGIVTAHEREASQALQELYIAADTLAAACTGTYVVVDGERRDLNMGLGVPLAEFVGLEGAETTRQAVFLIFDVDTRVALHFGEYQQWLSGANEEIDGELPKD